MRNGRVKSLLYPQSQRLERGDGQRENDDLSSYDFDLIVIGGGSGGLACSKVSRHFVINDIQFRFHRFRKLNH